MNETLSPQSHNATSAAQSAEKELFEKYGKMPTHRGLLGNKLKERKYFDSGDYALSKAGVAPQQSVGTAIPKPSNIPATAVEKTIVSSSPEKTSPLNLLPRPNPSTFPRKSSLSKESPIGQTTEDDDDSN